MEISGTWAVSEISLDARAVLSHSGPPGSDNPWSGEDNKNCLCYGMTAYSRFESGLSVPLESAAVVA
jgi:hypothetical protein